ncbi:hypothetical protein G6F68_012012 [Rhizopus microsporus]|nr:hypothetical protein G6F68_012012 [Rhizopus microsporus]
MVRPVPPPIALPATPPSAPPANMPTPLDLSFWITIGRTPLYTPLDALRLAQPPRTAIDVTTAAMANHRPVRGVTRERDLLWFIWTPRSGTAAAA